MARSRDSQSGLIRPTGRQIADRIERYRPRSVERGDWSAVRRHVVEATLAYAPESYSSTYLTMAVCARFSLWARDRGISIVVLRDLYVPHHVEHFLATGLSHLSGHSRASYGSALHRIAKNINKRAGWEPPPTQHGRKALSDPYADHELDWLHHIATTQGTEARRRAALSMWCLSYGAGLRGPEVGVLTGDDVHVVDGVAVVDVPGANARRVPVLGCARGDLLELAAQYPDSPMFSDRTPCRNWTASVLSQVTIPARAPRFSSRRLRISWMVTLTVAGVRLSELMDLAGLETTNGWEDLARFIPQRGEAELRGLIGGVQ